MGQVVWNVSMGQVVWSSRYEKMQFSLDCVFCSSGLWSGFRDVGICELSHLLVRLSDCAHELGPSLCDAFIAHFEVVQVVL